jgi:hypothetical protein
MVSAFPTPASNLVPADDVGWVSDRPTTQMRGQGFIAWRDTKGDPNIRPQNRKVAKRAAKRWHGIDVALCDSRIATSYYYVV